MWVFLFWQNLSLTFTQVVPQCDLMAITKARHISKLHLQRNTIYVFEASIKICHVVANPNIKAKDIGDNVPRPFLCPVKCYAYMNSRLWVTYKLNGIEITIDITIGNIHAFQCCHLQVEMCNNCI